MGVVTLGTERIGIRRMDPRDIFGWSVVAFKADLFFGSYKKIFVFRAVRTVAMQAGTLFGERRVNIVFGEILDKFMAVGTNLDYRSRQQAFIGKSVVDVAGQAVFVIKGFMIEC